MSTVIGKNRFLEDSFNDLLTMNSISTDSTFLKYGDTYSKLSDIASFPCPVIYLPSIEEDICNSCIEYALNEVIANFKEFSNNRHICIISTGVNPEIKERIYKKRCYITDNPLFNVSQANMPYYFVVDKNGHIECLFTPNFLFKEYTAAYWRQLKRRYKSLDGPTSFKER